MGGADDAEVCFPLGRLPRALSLVATVLCALVAAPPAMAQSAGEEVSSVMASEELSAPGPDGSLAGTLLLPNADDATGSGLADGAPVVLIVPGSGPTDRNGNSPLGIAAAPYKLLAEALAERGFASMRIDKRGMFGSSGAVPDPNDVTIAAYGDDLLAWVEVIRDRLPQEKGARCVVPLGHSEGGLVALAAMERVPNACGLILAAAPGRPLAEALREQLAANLANAPLLEQADGAIASLERGELVDETTLHPALAPLLAYKMQGFLIDAFAYDPVRLVRTVSVPVLVVQGERDLQVSEADARSLARGAPDATLALVPNANHVLKPVETDDPTANLATYADPALPVEPAIVDATVEFLTSLDTAE